MGDFQPALILFNAQGAPVLACRSARALLDGRDPGELLAQLSDGAPGRLTFDGEAYRVFRLWLHSQADMPPAIAVFLQPVPEQAAGVELARRHNLTRRESQVLELAAEGMATREIARKLGISAGTVSFFLRRVARKMGVASRAEIMANLIRGGGKAGSGATRERKIERARLSDPRIQFSSGPLGYVRSAPSSLPVESPK